MRGNIFRFHSGVFLWLLFGFIRRFCCILFQELVAFPRFQSFDIDLFPLRFLIGRDGISGCLKVIQAGDFIILIFFQVVKNCLWIGLSFNIIAAGHPHDMTGVAAGNIAVKISKQIAGIGFPQPGL